MGHLAAALAVLWIGAASAEDGSGFAHPEDGTVQAGAYTNRYFGLRVHLPEGWEEGLRGAPPSTTGTYRLLTAQPAGAFTATLRVGAQDMFFAAPPLADATQMVHDLTTTLAGTDGMRIDHGPDRVVIDGDTYARLRYSGSGLYSSLVATERRCHVVSIVITAQDEATRDALTDALVDLVSFGTSRPAEDETLGAPPCIKDYATAETVLRRAMPDGHDGRRRSIPARLVVGADGAVVDVHAIAGSAEDRARVETALAVWRLQPYTRDGAAVAVETGVTVDLD